MSDMASAMADTSDLTPYRGREVRRVVVSITNAGDGLSEALGIDPQEFEQGQEVHVLLRTIVGPHKHKVMKGYEDEETDAPLTLEITLRARDATIVPHDFGGDRLAAQRLAIQKAKDEAAGIGRLDGQPGTDGWDSEHAEMDGEPNGTVHQFPSNGGVVDAREESDSGTDDDDGYYDPETSAEPGEPDDSPL